MLATHDQERRVTIWVSRTYSMSAGPNFGQEYFGAGIEALRRRMADEPDDFTPFSRYLSAVTHHGLGETCRSICLGMTRRRHTVAVVDTSYGGA